MEFKADIGVIGALEAEVKEIISRLANRRAEVVGSIQLFGLNWQYSPLSQSA